MGAISSKPAKSSQRETQPARVAENVIAGSENKQIKGELPEGFFDNKDADLRARGIEPVKPDVKWAFLLSNLGTLMYSLNCLFA